MRPGNESANRRWLSVPSGLREVVRQLPELREPSGPATAVLALSAGFSALYGPMQRFDRWGPGGIALGQVFAFFALWRLDRSLFLGAAKQQQVHGEDAYRHTFFHLILPVVGGVAALFTRIAKVSPGRRLPQIPSFMLAFYLLGTGMALALRSLATLGTDTALLVPLYSPTRGRLVQTGPYRYVRHPFYGGLARLALGIALARRSTTAVAVAVSTIAWLSMSASMEEAELDTRFGEEYVSYRRNTPALTPLSPRAELEMLQGLALSQ